MLIGASDRAAMTPEQGRAYDAIAAGPRKDVPYPFLAMLDAPHLAEAIQAVGTAIRFAGAISDELREVAILSTAAAFGSPYEWTYHARLARQLGMSEEVIAATKDGRLAPGADKTTALTIALCRASVLERTVPQETLRELAGLVGRGVASEIVAIAGYYPMLALFLSAGDLEPKTSEL